ncbi:MAG: phage terminase small subunit [Candidatus Reddybacter sp.]
MNQTPAQRHRQRVQAKVEAEKNADSGHTDDHTGYELQLVQLAEHKRQLKSIQSIEKKVERKQALVDEYDAYIDGILEANKGGSDEVVTTLLLWHIDVGNHDRALTIAAYCLGHKLPTPDAHKRTMATLVAEEFADASLKHDSVSAAQLENVASLTATEDMPDQVRAKLHKALGYQYRTAKQLPQALAELQRALALNEAAGVKKDIERLQRELKNTA